MPFKMISRYLAIATYERDHAVRALYMARRAHRGVRLAKARMAAIAGVLGRVKDGSMTDEDCRMLRCIEAQVRGAAVAKLVDADKRLAAAWVTAAGK